MTDEWRHRYVRGDEGPPGYFGCAWQDYANEGPRCGYPEDELNVHLPLREPRYVLVDRDGIDTLHRDPGESCQMDDTSRDREIPAAEAMRLSMGGFVRRCGHCMKDEPSP